MQGNKTSATGSHASKVTATDTPVKPPSKYKGGNSSKKDYSVESVTSQVTSSGQECWRGQHHRAMRLNAAQVATSALYDVV